MKQKDNKNKQTNKQWQKNIGLWLTKSHKMRGCTQGMEQKESKDTKRYKKYVAKPLVNGEWSMMLDDNLTGSDK